MKNDENKNKHYLCNDEIDTADLNLNTFYN